MARNVIIVGRGNSISRLIYDPATQKASATDYTGLVNTEIKGSTRINCLSVLVRTLQQLSEKEGFLEETTPTVVYTVGMVADTINNGTFKHWLLGEGKKLNGEAVNESELELWQEFSRLYTELFSHIIIKNVADIRIPKNPRYAISMEQRILNDFVEKAWDRIKVTAPEIEESDDEAFN